MVGQGLVESPLEVWRTHAVGKVTVRVVAEEELAFIGHGCLDILSPVNVLLTAVHDTNVAWGETVTESAIS